MNDVVKVILYRMAVPLVNSAFYAGVSMSMDIWTGRRTTG
jgi:hypothetical protein